MTEFVPHTYQRDIIAHQLDVQRGATWAGMGTGKTVSTATALQIYQELVDPRPALVLAPKRVASYTWPREFKKWDHLTGEVSPILGSAQDRMHALRGGLRSGNISTFSINYENIPWLVETLADLKIKWPFGTIIADESTKLKSFRLRQGGARAQALNRVAWEHCDRFIELTGTPSPNGLKDLWGQAYFCDAGRRLGRSYSAYMNRWFQKDYTGFNWTPFEHSDKEIHAALADICLSVEHGLDTHEPIINKVMVDLPADVRRRYREMEKEAYTQIAGEAFEAVHAAARTNKLLQMCNGAIYDEHGGWTPLHDAKLQALESVIAEAAGMPVLVATNFKFDVPLIQKAFPQARVLDTNQDMDDWNAGKIAIGLGHPASMGHGLDLQDGGNIVAFFGNDWNLEFHDQIIERIGPVRQKQSGYDRPVYIHYLLVEDSIDEVVYDRRVDKRSVQDALMLAMKRRGLTP